MLARRVGQHAAFGMISSFRKQLGCHRHMLARVLFGMVDRVLPFLGEHLRRHLGSHLVQKLQLAPLRQAGRFQFRVLEIAADPMVGIEHEVLVGPLEIERQVEGLPNAGVLELRTANVECEGLHRRDGRDRQLMHRHLAALDCVEVERCGPGLRARLAPEIEFARLEGQERSVTRPEVDELYLVEVPLPLRHRQVLGPPIRDALIGDRATRIHVLDAIGARAQRNLERGLGKIARLAVGAGALPEMLGQNRQLADDHRQLAIAFDVEFEPDLAVTDLLGLDHVLVIEREPRRRLLDGLQREDHVFRRDRLAVVKACTFAQLKGGRREVVRVRRPLGDQAVLGRGLVGTARP